VDDSVVVGLVVSALDDLVPVLAELARDSVVPAPEQRAAHSPEDFRAESPAGSQALQVDPAAQRSLPPDVQHSA
jgi:hypothetical protein